MSRSLRLLTAATLAAALVSFSAPAEAATYAANGQRCTKVGTTHADRLVGTSRADVLCGRGGNDVIVGAGGNDVIDGGSGNDTISGGTGNDRVYAGSGRDTVSGDAGADRVDAGFEDDAVTGGSGNDTLLGGPGNDDLLGGDGTDVVDGGTGTNWCDDPAADQQVRCAVDWESPVVHEVRVDRTAVDVTSAAQTVTALLHVTDDTGVDNAVAEAHAVDSTQSVWSNGSVRTSGTPRDGWWRVRLTVPRFVPAATWTLSLGASDRIGRGGDAPQTWDLAVTDGRPDLARPVVRSFSVDRTTADVRSAPASMTVRVRATDDASGVEDVMACAVPLTPSLFDTHNDGCAGSNRSGGTALDGSWLIPFQVAQGAPSGTYAFRVCLDDKALAGRTQCWISEAEAAFLRDQGRDDGAPRIPGGGATLAVTGLDEDTHAPVLESVTVTPGEVDATRGTQHVVVAVHATDVEGLADGGVAVDVVREDGTREMTRGTWGWLDSGNTHDGVWTVSAWVQGGEPPGRYAVQVHLSDSTHRDLYAAADRLGHADEYPSSEFHAYTPEQAPGGGYLVVR